MSAGSGRQHGRSVNASDKTVTVTASVEAMNDSPLLATATIASSATMHINANSMRERLGSSSRLGADFIDQCAQLGAVARVVAENPALQIAVFAGEYRFECR